MLTIRWTDAVDRPPPDGDFICHRSVIGAVRRLPKPNPLDANVSDKNQNLICVDRWSNPETKAIYDSHWRNQPELQVKFENGDQCGGCSFFAAFNADWGLCCNVDSHHHVETVFEHFTCRSYVREGWGPHSFTKDTAFHCRCGGDHQNTGTKRFRFFDNTKPPFLGPTTTTDKRDTKTPTNKAVNRSGEIGRIGNG